MFLKLIHPDDAAAMTTILRQFLEGLRDESLAEFRMIRKDGAVIWVRERASVVKRDAAGKPLQMVGSIIDITGHKMMELTLKESEERYRRLFEVESDAIFLVSCSSGRFVDANQAALETYGYSKEELLGMVFTNISAEPDKSKASIENGESHIPLRWHRRKDGSVFPVEISGSYFDVQGDRLHVAAIRDISERIKAEQFREEAMERLEQQVAERTASLTAANERLSREIKERKQSETELLDYQRRLEELGLEISITEEQVRCRIASELHDQVGQCLMLSKIKVDSLADSELSPEQLATVKTLERLLEKTIHDIRSLTFQLRPPILVQAGLEAAVRWLADEFKEQHGLMVEFIDDRQPKPLGDELRTHLFQAVRELLLNVAKHAGTKRACVTMQKADDTLTIKVEDAGTGFDPTAAIMRRPRSGGFGLFNVQQRTQYFGGSFTIESSPGCGCTATIFAPLAAETSPTAKP
jgi:PAS domain S-box-containing protein